MIRFLSFLIVLLAAFIWSAPAFTDHGSGPFTVGTKTTIYASVCSTVELAKQVLKIWEKDFVVSSALFHKKCSNRVFEFTVVTQIGEDYKSVRGETLRIMKVIDESTNPPAPRFVITVNEIRNK